MNAYFYAASEICDAICSFKVFIDEIKIGQILFDDKKRFYFNARGRNNVENTNVEIDVLGINDEMKIQVTEKNDEGYVLFTHSIPYDVFNIEYFFDKCR